MRLSDLKIDYLSSPTGVTGTVSLSWVIHTRRRSVVQEGYQVQLLTGGSLIYDSGRVADRRSAQVPLCGPWRSITRYTVRVRVWAGGEETGWLERSFVTAFQDREEWRGAFLSAEPERDCGESYGTLLRRSFFLSKPVREAWLVSSAHGIYHSFLNGQRVSRDEMAPGWTSYQKRLLYQTYDVTGLLQPGENVLGVMLGAGWYKGMMGYKRTRNLYGGRTAFGGQLILRYCDGTEEWVLSDREWQCSRGPVLFSEIYGGERYDARLEQPGWDRPGFDSTGWRSVEVVERDRNTLTAQTGAAVRVQETLAPKAILQTPGGDTVLDFGQNLTGWCEITLDAPAGVVAELEFFEVLDGAGNVYTENLRGIHQIDRYICRGEGQEVYRPWFTFHGFQYVRLVSWPGTPRLEQFAAQVVHSEMEPSGTFSCSHPLVNQLHHNILCGMKGNFLDIPSDCPQRDERLGWTGDVQVFGGTACHLMNTDAFFRKWLADVAADQTAEGAVAHVVPDILTGHMEGDWLLSQPVQGGASGWGDVAVTLPWELYLAYGDREILARQMDSMIRWVSFLEQHSEGCLFRYGAQFGDWLALDAQPGSYKGATPDEYVSAAFYCHVTRLMGKICRALDRAEEARTYEEKSGALRAHFQSLFFTPAGDLKVQTQTAHVLALAFQLAPETCREKIAERLKALLTEAGGHLTTGFLGTPYLTAALSENGGLQEAYALLLREEFPGWLYQVKQGATTVWEHWDGRRPDGTMWSPDMNSFNHYAYGCIGQWLYRTVAGLQMDEERPGYEHFFLRPRPGGGLTHAEAVYQSIHGRIRSGWRREGEITILTVEIPANTSADICLEDGAEVLEPDGLTFLNGRAAAGSGSYQIRYQISRSHH